MTQILEITDLHKSFGSLEVLKGVSLDAKGGDVVSLIGSSGSGKSTLLRCINMLEIPNQGDVTIDGEHVSLSSVWSRRARERPRPSDRRRACGVHLSAIYRRSHRDGIEAAPERAPPRLERVRD